MIALHAPGDIIDRLAMPRDEIATVSMPARCHGRQVFTRWRAKATLNHAQIAVDEYGCGACSAPRPSARV